MAISTRSLTDDMHKIRYLFNQSIYQVLKDTMKLLKTINTHK